MGLELWQLAWQNCSRCKVGWFLPFFFLQTCFHVYFADLRWILPRALLETLWTLSLGWSWYKGKRYQRMVVQGFQKNIRIRGITNGVNFIGKSASLITFRTVRRKSKHETVTRYPLSVVFESRPRMTAHLGGPFILETLLLSDVSGCTGRYLSPCLSFSL